MKNIKLLTIFSIMSLLTLCGSSVYAGNLGRTVYGVFSETYAGVSGGDSSSEDFVNFYPDHGAGSNSSECVEGKAGIVLVSSSWYTEPFGDTSGKDMSMYSRIYFSVKFPSTGNTDKAYIRIKDTAERQIVFNSTNIKCVDSSSSEGVLKDDTWHTYYIELASFTNLDLSHVTIPLILAADPTSGTFYVDNVVYAKSGAVLGNGSPVLEYTLKNVSNNGNASSNDKFTWNSSVFGEGWKTADQYADLEIKFKNGSNDVDMLSLQSLQDLKKWSFRIYTSSQTEAMENGKYIYTTHSGLIPYGKYNSGELFININADPNRKLPLCWRMIDSVLSTTSGSAHTNIIGEKNNTAHDLYDLGSSDPNRANWNCWLYVTNIANITDDEDIEYATIWNYRGSHASSDSSTGFSCWANPKLYIAAKFTEALMGLEYRNKITIESYYE